MSVVLSRAFRILDLLASSPSEARSLGDIASHMSVNASTCAFLMKGLVSEGAAVQVAPRKGYLLGPRLRTLAQETPYRADLAQIARPPMQEFSDRTGEACVLVALNSGQRDVLAVVHGKGDVQVRNDFHDDNTYSTATGRVLLAYAGPGELAAFVKANGLPGSRWPEAKTRVALEAQLRRIRRAESLQVRGGAHLVQVAWPVREAGRVVAAFGTPVPQFRFRAKHREFVLSEAARVVSRVEGSTTRANGGD